MEGIQPDLEDIKTQLESSIVFEEPGLGIVVVVGFLRVPGCEKGEGVEPWGMPKDSVWEDWGFTLGKIRGITTLGPFRILLCSGF